MQNPSTQATRRLALPDLDLLKVHLDLQAVKTRSLSKALGIRLPQISNALAGRRPLPERLWVALYELAGLECPLLAPFDSKPRLWGVPSPTRGLVGPRLACDRLTLLFDRLPEAVLSLAAEPPIGWCRQKPPRTSAYRAAASTAGLFLEWHPYRRISPLRLDWTPTRARAGDVALLRRLFGSLNGRVSRVDIAVDYPSIPRTAVEIIGVRTRTGEIRHDSGRSCLVPFDERGALHPRGRHSRVGSAKRSHWRCYPHPVEGTDPTQYVTRIEAQRRFEKGKRSRLVDIGRLANPFETVEVAVVGTPLPYPHDVVLRDLWRYGPDWVRVRFGDHGRWRQFLSSLTNFSDHYELASPSALFDERWAAEAARVQTVFGVEGVEHA